MEIKSSTSLRRRIIVTGVLFVTVALGAWFTARAALRNTVTAYAACRAIEARLALIRSVALEASTALSDGELRAGELTAIVTAVERTIAAGAPAIINDMHEYRRREPNAAIASEPDRMIAALRDFTARASFNEDGQSPAEFRKHIGSLISTIDTTTAETAHRRAAILAELGTSFLLITIVSFLAVAAIFSGFAVFTMKNILRTIGAVTGRFGNILSLDSTSKRAVSVLDIENGGIVRQTEALITRISDIILDMKQTIETQNESLTGLSQILTFLTDKSTEQISLAERELESVQRLSQMMNDVTESSGNQQVNLGLLIARIADFTRILESTEKDFDSQISAVNEIAEVSESGKEYLRQTNESMILIGENSKKMDGILQLIVNISDRINLLSLNAAIESARAGEHGRGFAVVANEISKLADQTASSIKEISALIVSNDSVIRDALIQANKTIETIAIMVNDIITVKEVTHRSCIKIEAQIKNNYIVTEESADVKREIESISRLIDRQSNEINSLLSAITTMKENSQYCGFLTGRIVSEAQESMANLAALTSKIDRFHIDEDTQRGDSATGPAKEPGAEYPSSADA